MLNYYGSSYAGIFNNMPNSSDITGDDVLDDAEAVLDAIVDYVPKVVVLSPRAENVSAGCEDKD